MTNKFLNLDKIYDETGGKDWTNRDKWLSDEPIHEWHGVSVEDNSEDVIVVNKIILSHNNLKSNLQLSWSILFASIQVVDLSHNQLSGSILGIFDGLMHLKELRLNDNQLSGILPLLKDLKRLEILCLDKNEFEGEIPIEYGELASLQELRLTTNKLSGIFPEELKHLTQIKKLYMDVNKFTGPFPSWIVELVTLEELDIGQNKLTGEIPETICELKNLKILGLGDNKFTGNIPKSIYKMATLERLWLFKNKLEGEIPVELEKLLQLKELLLYINQLSGEIPSSLGQLSKLTKLYLYENQLTGEIPSSLSQLSELNYLGLSQNQLTGEIPSSLGQLSQLMYLGLYQNQLTGEIPSSLGQLSQLTKLYLYQNQLTGEIPSSLGQLSELIELYLEKNQLIGCLPPSFSNLNKLTDLTLEFNQLSGDLSSLAWSNMISLKNVRLQHNRFSGLIPVSLINHSALETLELSGHEFSQSFDGDISKLKWKYKKYWYTNYDVNEAMFKACQRGYIRIIKYLIESKNYSNFLQKDKDGKHALDYLLLSNPYGALELFITADTHESDSKMYQKLENGTYNYEKHLENQFEYNLNDREYCIRGSDEEVIDGFWFKKIGDRIDMRKLLQKYFPLYRASDSMSTLFSVHQSKPKVISLEANAATTDEKDISVDNEKNIDIYMSLHALWSSTSYPVTSYTLPFEDMSSVEFLHVFVTLFDKTIDVQLFENENVKVAILAAWEGYGRWYHICFLLLYMAFLITLSYSNYAYQSGHDLVVTIILLTLNLLFLLYEVAQVFKFGIRKYLSGYENVIEVAGTVLVAVGCILRFVFEEETDNSKAVMALASILLWTNALNYLRPFSLTGSLVRLVFTTIKAIIPFLLILALVLYGFSQAFYLLTYDNANYDEFTSSDRAYLFSFVYMMGQSAYHLGDDSNSKMMIALTLLFITFAQILLLNLLIAFLNNIYSDIQSRPEAQMLSERCRIITSQLRYWHVNVPRYIHFIKKDSDVQKDERLKQDRLNTNTELRANLDDKLTAVEGNVEKALDSIRKEMALIHSTLVLNQLDMHSNHHQRATDVLTVNTTDNDDDDDDDPLPYVDTLSAKTVNSHIDVSEINKLMSLYEDQLKTIFDNNVRILRLEKNMESLHTKMDIIIQAVSENKSNKSGSTSTRFNNDNKWINVKKE